MRLSVCSFACVVVVVVVAASLATASPSKPVWPPEWTATMEFEHLPTGERTLGVYMYSQEAEYVALVNGNADGLCAGSGFVKENEPCINLATHDWRWIIDPVDQDCCACCTNDQGCGPLNTHWIANSNSSYVDTATYYNLQANKWLIQGNDANYYYETAESRIPLALSNGGADNLYIWNTGSWTPKADPSFFKVPSFCDASNLCDGFCKVVRNM